MKAEREGQRAVIMMFNKSTGVPKEIWIDLDLDYVQWILDRAGRINGHVEAGTVPDRVPYRPNTCGRCDFRHVCLPDMKEADAVAWLDDEALAEDLDERGELESAGKRFKTLDGEIKEALKARYAKGTTRIFVGDWLCEGKQSANGSWRTTIESLKQEEPAP
jgi:hypothetical protein